MTDTSQHIKDLQLALWLSKSPGVRLYQFLMDNSAALVELRNTKTKMGIPLGELDFAEEYRKRKTADFKKND